MRYAFGAAPRTFFGCVTGIHAARVIAFLWWGGGGLNCIFFCVEVVQSISRIAGVVGTMRAQLA